MMKYLVLVICLTCSTLVCRGAWACSDFTPRSNRLPPQRHPSAVHGRKLVQQLSTATVTNAAEFIAAMADQSVRLVRVTVPDLKVPASAWDVSGFPVPILLSRDLAIEGNPALGDLPVLDFQRAKQKMRLAANITLRLEHLFLVQMRPKPTRAPGLDILAPTIGGMNSTLLFSSLASSFGVCWPLAYQAIDLDLVQQQSRPIEYPGATKLTSYETYDMLKQAGCVDNVSAPPMQRCWAAKLGMEEIAVVGADYDELRDRLVPNNMILRIINSTAVCELIVDEQCLSVEGKEPLLCYTESERKLEAIWAAEAAAAAVASSGISGESSGVGTTPSVVESSSTSGSVSGGRASTIGLTGGARVGVICGASIAGALLVLVMVAMVVRINRWRRFRGTAPTTSAAATAGCGISSEPAGGGMLRRPKLGRGQQQAKEEFDGIPDGANWDGRSSNRSPSKPPSANSREDGRVSGRLHRHTDMPVTPHTRPRREVALSVQLLETPAPPPQQQPAADYPSPSQSAEQPPQSPAGEVERGRGNSSSSCCDSGGGSSGNGNGNADGRPPVVQLLPVTLGKGSFGRVVEGTYNGRRVAVKLMAEGPWGSSEEQKEHQQQESDDVAVHPNAFLQSFMVEVEVLSRVQHPNVVQLLAACVTPPRLCLVMELMETSLERLLYGKRRTTRDGGNEVPSPGDLMPLNKVLYIGIEIASALAYLHPTIVHRDLKPANVLVNGAEDDRPVIKISDFGLSRLRVTVATTQHPDAGTPPYMAPECFDVSNRHITHKADIYSLGVLVWEMLVGCRPWAGVSPVAVAYMVAYQGCRLPLVTVDPSRCPPKLANLLQSCWEADPARRPAAAEAAKQLALVLEKLKQHQ